MKILHCDVGMQGFKILLYGWRIKHHFPEYQFYGRNSVPRCFLSPNTPVMTSLVTLKIKKSRVLLDLRSRKFGQFGKKQ